GNLQRLGLARALLHAPELVVLDEPANGLDPAGVVEIRQLLSGLAREQGVTIFMSSHILAEVDRLATRIGIIHKGRLIEELDTVELERRRQLRGLTDADPAVRAEARRAATSAFLAAPLRWRAVVEMAVHLATLRAIEDVLGQRLLLKDEGGRQKDEENSDCNARFSLHPSSFRERLASLK